MRTRTEASVSTEAIYCLHADSNISSVRIINMLNANDDAMTLALFILINTVNSNDKAMKSLFSLIGTLSSDDKAKTSSSTTSHVLAKI